ncbi:hypothetical protein PAAG_06690 [Paracoccidioides lutzii Pb01]|uniref:Uncharacterized protein n=1 Tax=Paracoccidioides lutzii (strain ATCC MYA-826 / Pb01) TaxID=502779 RepID=C1H7E9_PARBA|nr:hypothetical protein PAAG_06690 [Paracoccidioides lutzii Pb01]EEH35643.2 hypothetical protein PAAG_06690 [Paracoccidioides lutzii Pb01]
MALKRAGIILTGLQCLFREQFPKMPKDYIARLIYDRAHLSIAIVKMPLVGIGGISFREFRDRKFAEAVFCAVSSDQQKQHFPREISLDKAIWKGSQGLRRRDAHAMLHASPNITLSQNRASPPQWTDSAVTPTDPLSIPAILTTGWSPEILSNIRQDDASSAHVNSRS